MRKIHIDRQASPSRRPLLEPLEERRLLASIAGVVFEDINANGFKESNEAGMVNTRVYVDLNNNGVFDGSDIHAFTNAQGQYQISNLAQGTYTVRVEKPIPWRFSSPASGAYTVNLPAASTALTDYDFGLNPPPKVLAPPTQQVPEGPVPISMGLFTDADVDGPWQITVNWGDGSPNRVFSQANAGPIADQTHAFADNGQYGVAVTVTDKHGQSNSMSFTVRVTNVPPTATLQNGGPIMEGQAVGVWFVNPFDPSPVDMAAGFLYSFDFNSDGVYEVVDSPQPFATTVYTQNKIQTVTARIKDKDGGVTTYATQVVIQNAPPTLALSGPNYITINAPYTLNLSYSDPGDDEVIFWAINWGDGQSSVISPAAPTANHVYAAPGNYTITASATDNDGTWEVPVPLTVTVGIPFGTITGVVINDVDGNGKKAPREPVAANRIVFIDYDYNGKWSPDEPRAVTSAAGVYEFANIPAGTYRVQIAMPRLWMSSNPTTGFRDVTVLPGHTAFGNNFFITQRNRIAGNIFLDANRNGRRDAKEKALGNWRVFIDANNDGKLNPGELWARTTATGAYVMNGVTTGTHKLKVLTPKGFSLTAPKKEEYVIKVGRGQTVAGRIFGAVKIRAK